MKTPDRSSHSIMASQTEQNRSGMLGDIAMAVVLVVALCVGAHYFRKDGEWERRGDQVTARLKSVEREATKVDNKRSRIDYTELLREIDILEDEVTELNAVLKED